MRRSRTYVAVLVVVSLAAIVQIVAPWLADASTSSPAGTGWARHEREAFTQIVLDPLAAPSRPLPGVLVPLLPRSLVYLASAVQVALLARRLQWMARSRTTLPPAPWNPRWRTIFLILLGSWIATAIAVGVPYTLHGVGRLIDSDGADWIVALAMLLGLGVVSPIVGFPSIQIFGPAFLGFEIDAIRREGFWFERKPQGPRQDEPMPPRADRAPHTLEGGRLRLRRSTPEDASATFRLSADPDVMRYLDWPAHGTEADARAFLRGCAERWRTGAEYHWMIEEIASGTPVGCIGVRLEDGVADFGYFLGRTFWGRGYASEACGLLLAWLRGRSRVRRIQATTDFENVRSAHVLEKLGLRLESVRPAATVRPNLGGPPRDTFVFVLADPA